MIYQVRILSRIPADDGSGETILKSRELYVDGVALAGVAEIRDRMHAAKIDDVIVEAPTPIEMATTAGVSESVDEAMRERYGTGAANLAEIEGRELARAVINQGKTLNALAEAVALLSRAVMRNSAADAGEAAGKLSAIPVLRTSAPVPLEIDRERFLGGVVEREAVELAGPEDTGEGAAVRAARALIAEVDGRRPGRGELDVRLPIDTSTAPPTLIQRGPDGRLVPQIPVIGTDGQSTERLGSSAAANVGSRGWGVAGKGASSSFERFDGEGRLVASPLPKVGDTLKVPRSDIE